MNKKIRRVIRRIAKENGVSPEEVKTEIMNAIRAGIHNPDPQVQAVWNSISPGEEAPDITACLTWAVNRIRTGG